MARLARVVVVGVPHHITQRGNNHQYILNSDEERLVYLDLLAQNAALYELSLVGYCRMSNHVHLVGVPRLATSLARALKETHGRFATQWNARHRASGHAWQGRPYSCPLGPPHLWTALRYVELNPVRAGMVRDAAEYRWSSAAAHFGAAAPHPMLDMELWQQHWRPEEWRAYVRRGETAEEVAAIRACTFSGRPLGSDEFIRLMEERLQRTLVPDKGGRPRKPSFDPAQRSLFGDPEKV